jgi:lipid A 3-O-deacylase
MLRVVLVLYLLVFTSSCTMMSFRFENDVFAGTDENFTNAVELKGHLVQSEESTLRDVYQNLPDLEYLLKEPNIDKISIWEFGLRQDMYTPTDITDREIIREDNPYAGTLTIDLTKINRSKYKRSSTTLRAGASGQWSLADRTQRFVHEALASSGRGQKIPQGWRHQVKSEPIFNLDMDYSILNPLYRGVLSENTLTLRLGTIKTEAEYTFGLRSGYNVPNYLEETSENLRAYAKFDMFNQVRVHNLYYRGGVFRDSPHTVSMENHVIGVRAGLVLGYGNYQGSLEYIRQSRDYKQQKRSLHDYGLLSLGVNW